MYQTNQGWATDGNVQALRIDPDPESSVLLPYDQFVFAELTKGGTEQRLRIVYATHEVLLRGHSLRRLYVALQTRDLAYLGLLPEPLRAGVPDGDPVLLHLEITQTNQNQ